MSERYEFCFRLEMAENAGPRERTVHADSCAIDRGWVLFYRRGEPFKRFNTQHIVSIQTERNP